MRAQQRPHPDALRPRPGAARGPHRPRRARSAPTAGASTVAGSSVRYRRRVRAFHRVEMRSAFVGRDARFLYVAPGDVPRRRGALGRRSSAARSPTPDGIVPTDRVVAALGDPELRRPARLGRRLEPTPRPQRPWPPGALSMPAHAADRPPRRLRLDALRLGEPAVPDADRHLHLRALLRRRGGRRPGARPGALGRGRRHRRRRSSRSSRPSSAPSPTAPARASAGCSPSRCPTSLGCLGFWLADARHGRPRRSSSSSTSLAFVGSEFGHGLHQRHAPRPRPAQRDRPHLRLRLGARLPRRPRLAGPRPPPPRPRARAARPTLLGIPPILGLDVAAGEPARATGPLVGALVPRLRRCRSSSSPPTSRRGARRGVVRAGLADLAATFRLATRAPQLLRLPHRLDGLPRRAGRALHLRRHLRRRRPRLGPLPARRLRHRRRRRRHRSAPGSAAAPTAPSGRGR